MWIIRVRRPFANRSGVSLLLYKFSRPGTSKGLTLHALNTLVLGRIWVHSYSRSECTRKLRLEAPVTDKVYGATSGGMELHHSQDVNLRSVVVSVLFPKIPHDGDGTGAVTSSEDRVVIKMVVSVVKFQSMTSLDTWNLSLLSPSSLI